MPLNNVISGFNPKNEVIRSAGLRPGTTSVLGFSAVLAFNPEVFRKQEEKMRRKKLARLQNTAAALGCKLLTPHELTRSVS